jgi:hypothetical protein
MSLKSQQKDKWFRKDIPEFKYVITGSERTHVSVSKNLKSALKVYQRHKKIRTLTEAIWRACALGMRDDLVGEDPRLPAIQEIRETIIKYIREKR